MRDLGTFTPRRPSKFNGPLCGMVLNAVHDLLDGKVFAVQVGANDGQMADPLWSRFRDDGWSGLLIEPHPMYFANLSALHGDNDRVSVLNAGISDVAGTLPLYHLADHRAAKYPRWTRGCASLDRARMERALEVAAVPDASPDDLALTDVALMRLDDVLRERDISAVDIVVIDVEGHELSVLSSFDLAALGVTAAIVECNGPNLAQEAAYISALEAAELTVYRLGDDLVGLRPVRLVTPLEELLRFFGKSIDRAGAPT